MKLGDRVSFALAKTHGPIFRPSGEVQQGEVRRAFLAGWHVSPRGKRMTVRIYRDEEGLWWARGWRTKAVAALRVAVALAP